MKTGQVSRPVTWRIYSSNECPLKYTLHDSFWRLKSCLLTFQRFHIIFSVKLKCQDFFLQVHILDLQHYLLRSVRRLQVLPPAVKAEEKNPENSGQTSWTYLSCKGGTQPTSTRLTICLQKYKIQRPKRVSASSVMSGLFKKNFRGDFLFQLGCCGSSIYASDQNECTILAQFWDVRSVNYVTSFVKWWITLVPL